MLLSALASSAFGSPSVKQSALCAATGPQQQPA
jgi:hypothetical protein